MVKITVLVKNQIETKVRGGSAIRGSACAVRIVCRDPHPQRGSRAGQPEQFGARRLVGVVHRAAVQLLVGREQWAELAADAGLHVYAAPLPDRDLVAAAWQPPEAFADHAGCLSPAIVGTALDCPGQFAWYDKGLGPALLGRMTLRIDRPVRAERCVVRLSESGVELNPNVVAYLNRLSDLLWLFGRLLELRAGVNTRLRDDEHAGPRWSRAW